MGLYFSFLFLKKILILTCIGIRGKLQTILQKLEEWIHPNEAILHSIYKSPSIQILSTPPITAKTPPSTQIFPASEKALARRDRRLMHVLMTSSAGIIFFY